MTRRKRLYFTLMATCVTLFVLSWSVIRLFSTPAAVVVAMVAMILPPVAAIVANNRGPDERWWDEPPGPSQRLRIPRQRRPDDRNHTPPR